MAINLNSMSVEEKLALLESLKSDSGLKESAKAEKNKKRFSHLQPHYDNLISIRKEFKVLKARKDEVTKTLQGLGYGVGKGGRAKGSKGSKSSKK